MIDIIENTHFAENTPAEVHPSVLDVAANEMVEPQPDVPDCAPNVQPNEPLLLGDTPPATCNSSSQVEDAPADWGANPVPELNKATNDTAAIPATASAVETTAVRMAEMGIAVFPLQGVVNGNCTCKETGCSSVGKHPRLPTSFDGSSSSPKLVAEWFRYYPGINYGVATGQRVNGGDKMLVVVDIDAYKPEARDTMDDLEAKYGPLPDTVTAQTGGGGRHLYYYAPAGIKFKSKLGPGVDFKGIGGYVVGPGSVHASGKSYVFEADSDLLEGHAIADLPQWIIDDFSVDAAKSMAPMAVARSATLSPVAIISIKLDLRYLDANDYDVWTKVLMALKSTGDEVNARDLAETWSATSSKYDAADFNHKWVYGIRPDGDIGIGTIAYLAQEIRVRDVDISAIINKVQYGALSDVHKPPHAEGALTGNEWPVLRALNNDFGVQSVYPLCALPDIIRDAVVEVQEFVQAPMAMVACSALATLSLAAQALHDVERAPMLTGPISLYILSIADSGERKSTLDSFFAKPIQDFEQECARKAAPLLADYAADQAAWEATKKGIADRIARNEKDNKRDQEDGVKMRAHQAAKPAPPPVPRLIYSDTTPEALLYNIAVEWPSAGIVSSEGGAVLGGHGMSAENQMRNLATINALWDGKPIRTDRRGSGSLTADGRLSVAIQVQAPTLKTFIHKSGDLARGTGFLARFLTTWPPSTQGTRLYAPPPAEWPMLENFRARIKNVLELPQRIENGRVQPTMLRMTKAAQDLWVAFHNEIELQLGLGGEFHDVRDVASKTADNAARMAALFHIMVGDDGDIDERHLKGAADIMRWHLTESQRVLSSTDCAPETTSAAKLDAWLIKYCKEHVVSGIGYTEALRLAPRPMRKKELLAPPLAVLVEAGRAKCFDGRIEVNPVLLAD